MFNSKRKFWLSIVLASLMLIGSIFSGGMYPITAADIEEEDQLVTISSEVDAL